MKHTDWKKITLRPLTSEEKKEYGDEIEFMQDGKTPELDEEVLVYTSESEEVYTDIWVDFNSGEKDFFLSLSPWEWVLSLFLIIVGGGMIDLSCKELLPYLIGSFELKQEAQYDSIVLLSFYKQGYLEINKREHSLF